MATLSKISIMAIAIAIAMVLVVTIAMNVIPNARTKAKTEDDPIVNKRPLLMPSKRINRFLEANKVVGTNPRAAPEAADHCKNNNTVCDSLGGKCCHNKCMDLSYDKNNCGTCMNKCKFTHTCCNGECVMLAFDKRHCMRCNNRCPEGQLCVYGMCNYA